MNPGYTPSPLCSLSGNWHLNSGIKSLRATLSEEIFAADFASWTMHFVNICVKNKQMQQLFIQFINYTW
jgi:hypothetical protein